MLTTGVACMLAAAPVLAASATDDPGIQKRMDIQQKRIDQGGQSGQITPKEEKKLDKQQQRIKKKEARMKSDGKLTKKERAKLTKEQNKASQKIYKEKHDNQVVPPATPSSVK